MLEPSEKAAAALSSDSQLPQVSRGENRPRRDRPAGNLGERVQSLRLARLPERQTTVMGSLAWIVGTVALAAGAWYGYASYFGAGPGVATPAAASAPVAADDRSRTSTAPTVPAPQPSEKSVTVNPKPPAALPSKADVVLEAKGYIVPAHQILVSPKVSGMIVTLNVEEGRRVNKGDMLAVLESTDYEADVQRATAAVNLMQARLREMENGNRPEEIQEAEAAVREAEAQLPQLEAEYRRNAELRRKNSVAQQDFELSESKYLAQVQRVQRLRSSLKLMELGPRQERIDSARAELAQAQADLTKAQWRLSNCTIRAPVTGTILKKNAEEGNIVNAIAFNGSYSLCDMADLSDLEVDLNVQERDIAAVKVGQRCRVRAEAYPDRIYEGVVDRLMPIADRAKGAIPVRIKIQIPANEEGIYLKPEMGAIVVFLNLPPATPAVAVQQPVSTPAPMEATH